MKTVFYHDTSRRKPHPDPLLRGLELLEIQAHHALPIGDDPKDTAAARSAGIFSVGALWGAVDREALIASRPDALCETVTELHAFILDRA